MNDAPSIAVNPSDTIGVALVTLLGPWGALAALAYKFGTPFVTKLIENSKKAGDPTLEEWTALNALVDVPGEVLIPQRAVPGV